MLFLSILIGKTILLIGRLFGRAGSALPGLIVQKIYPPFLKKTLGKLPSDVIIVTGTNGKTTTTKIISDLLSAHGLRVLTNRTGSNFVRGIISTTIKHISWSTKLPYDIAVLEQDEAYAVHLVKYIQPSGVVALNVMRDQMDRFGEIDKTAELIGRVVSQAADFVVLNANDPRLASLKRTVRAPKTIWFGHSEKLLNVFVSDDQLHTHKSLKYFSANDIDARLESVSDRQVKIRVGGRVHDFQTKLDGGHNALNITAALAVVQAVKPDADMAVTTQALTRIQPAFGRGEVIVLKNGTKVRLQLVKNPASFSHALRILKDNKYSVVGIVINDDYADGRDVSWLWDVDFAPLASGPDKIFCGGVRAWDMANRLKYDEISTAEINTNFERFLKDVRSASRSQKPVVIFCTYTAMLKIRKLLKPHSQKMSEKGL